MQKINKLLDKVSGVMSKIAGGVAGISICFLCLFIAADIILRKVTGAGIFGSYEITQLFFAMIVFSCFTVTQFSRRHIHVYVLIRLFPEKIRFAITFLGELLCCAMSGTLTVAIFRESFRQFSLPGCKTEILGIRTWPVYFICACVCVLLTSGFLAEVLRNFMAVLNKEVAEDVEKDWV